MKRYIFVISLLLFSTTLLFSGSLEETIPVDKGMIEYFFFIDGGFGLMDPYSFDWSKEVDSSGDEYILASSIVGYWPEYYYFYNLTEDKVENEYDYFSSLALSLNRDKDKETSGTIGKDYIFFNTLNQNKSLYGSSDYIGNKVYFTKMQQIPYSKFNLVWESGGMVMDY